MEAGDNKNSNSNALPLWFYSETQIANTIPDRDAGYWRIGTVKLVRDRVCGRVLGMSTTSNPYRKASVSRFNGWPTRSPVNASRAASQPTAHDSGPMWVATSSLRWTCTIYSLPVSRRTVALTPVKSDDLIQLSTGEGSE
jgi:hypothetical protein